MELTGLNNLYLLNMPRLGHVVCATEIWKEGRLHIQYRKEEGLKHREREDKARTRWLTAVTSKDEAHN